jgi:dolichyl-phosphate-mannose--protein O-mannosyl transferase
MTWSFKNKEGFFLTLFLAIYSVLLLININQIYLFIGDEPTYVSTVNSLINGVIDRNNHPLLAKSIWAFFVFLFQAITGTDKAVFWRLGTVIFSVGTLALFFKISRLFFSKTTSFIALVILALDPMYFSFSRLVQLDIIMLFFSLFSLYCLLLYFKDFRTKNIYLTGLFLGLSIAAKMSSILMLIVISCMLIFYHLKEKNFKLVIPAIYGFLVFTLGGYVLGNVLFLILPTSINLFEYTRSLISSQLSSQIIEGSYLISPAWSWFTVPQILMLYRVEFANNISSIVAFQNPLLFASTIISVFLTFILILKKRIKKILSYKIILLYFLAHYLPWFFSIHPTYYYYIIPLLPVSILMLVNLIVQTAKPKYFLYFFLGFSLLIFALYYPLLTGLSVPKGYECSLMSYSQYQFPPKNSLFCKNCSPRK